MLVVDNDNVDEHDVQVLIVRTESKHIRELAKTMRKADQKELLSFGLSIEKVLWRSWKGSVNCWTAMIDGKVAAIWGACGAYLGTTAAPWLLTSDEVYKISPLRFARIYQKEVETMLKMFPRLENYVDASYTGAVRLLRIIGFTLGEPEAKGVNGELFRKFEMKGN